MSELSNRQSCLDAETIAAFAEGKLTRREIAPVLAHLRSCPRCMAELEALQTTASHRSWTRILAAAAAVIVVVAAGVFAARRLLVRRSSLAQLAALSSKTSRPVEPRLGGFAWSPYVGPMRASDAALDPQRMKLIGAAGELLDRSQRDASPDAQHTAGVALLLVGRPSDAVTKLRAAADARPNDATVRSDLAAAEYASAEHFRAASLYPAALADADAALRLDPRNAEALFNRALILERLRLPQAAREAWQRYLAVDPSSKWAGEARAHLSHLPTTTSDAQFRAEQPRLERAAIAGDAATVAAIVDRFRQQSRAYGEGEYLGHWGEAEQRGDAAEAARQLTVARALGDALAQRSHEGLLRAAVAAIDAAPPARRRDLAEAHVAYRRGRIAYSRQSPAAAEPDLRHAAQLFAAASDPMALVARYYAANTRFDRNDVAGARAELEALLPEADADPRSIALGAHVRWEIALCLMNDDDWSGVLPLVRDAAARFGRIGEASNRGFLETMQADALAVLGRPDEAWAARIRSFDLLSASGRGDRLAVSLGGAVRWELRSGRLSSARSLLGLERDAQRGLDSGTVVVNALMLESVLDAQLGNEEAAASHAREAALAAERIPDAALRARALVDVDLAGAAAALARDPRSAARLLDQAVDGYRATGAPLFLAECHLLRARARLRLGDRAGAQRDLDDGIAVYERHPIRFVEGVVGTGVLDAGAALYRDAVALALARGDSAAAFAYAERSFAQIGTATPIVSFGELQQRLRASGALVLELVVLPDEVVIFSVSGDRAEVHRQSIAERQLVALADAAANDDRHAAASLYDLLLRPAAPQLARARQAIVIAAPQLARVPFAALKDSATGRLVAEQLPLALAPSASALRAEPARSRPRSIVAVELASDDVALPGSAEELAEVQRFYAQPTAIAGAAATPAAFLDAAKNADVIHLSGHSGGEPSVAEAVLFLGPPGQRERMSWRRLSVAALSRSPVVVLAACDTLHAPRARWTRALSLGGAFLAAGAGDVVGTLTPIADSDARLFFLSVHRHLAAGLGAAEAVRQAQLESIRDPHRTAWRSVAVMTTRVPAF